MKRIILLAIAIVAASPAHAFTRTSRFTWNGVTTVCTYTSPYGTNCYTTGVGTGNSARVIQVDPEQPVAKPGEPEMTEAERAAARRATCTSRSVVCLPEPAW
jgi:hypothetical protein